MTTEKLSMAAWREMAKAMEQMQMQINTELLEALQATTAALENAICLLIEADHDYRPTEHAEWEPFKRGKAAIAKALGEQS